MFNVRFFIGYVIHFAFRDGFFGLQDSIGGCTIGVFNRKLFLLLLFLLVSFVFWLC